MANEVPPPTSDLLALAAECQVDFVRAGGPGGQHRNKRCTGVRLMHLPTGVLAQATERRSQARNLQVALERLADLLAARAHVPTPRRPTRPSAGVRRRRLEGKRQRSQVKSLRRAPAED
jgi:protein subunit release factor A